MFGAWGAITDAALGAERSLAKARSDRFVAECRAMHAPPVMSRETHPGDCPSCGSQEFRRWRGVSVCAYCRSTAQAASVAPEAYSTSLASKIAAVQIEMLKCRQDIDDSYD